MENIKYNEYFLPILVDCQRKYKTKFSNYGESWKTMVITKLQQRLFDEVQEYDQSYTIAKDYQELLDIINIALMLAKRIRTKALTKGDQ